MATCKKCQARMMWGQTDNGKHIPLDPDPHESGNVRVRLIGGKVYAHVCTEAEILAALDANPDERFWRSHFATCPAAAAFRQPKLTESAQ